MCLTGVTTGSVQMTDCEILLIEAIAKRDASFNREARHSVAAALLSEATVHCIEHIAPMLGSDLSLVRARGILQSVLGVLMRAHEQSILAQDGKKLPPVRFSSTSPYVWHLLGDDP